MNKLAIAKFAVTTACGLGVSKVTNDIIANNTDTETTEDKIKVAIGAAVIGSMVAERASDHVEHKLEQIAKLWNNRKNSDTPEDIS